MSTNMTKRRLIKAIAFSLALASLASTMTGCGASKAKESFENRPLAQFANIAEVKEYYTKELSYDSILKRDYLKNTSELVLEDVPEDKVQILTDMTHQIEEILALDSYDEPTPEQLKLISVEGYNFFKSQIDSLALNNGAIKQIKQAKGFYFVDVEYDISAQEPGTFKENADMTGINGLWEQDINKKWVISDVFKNLAEQRLNDYFFDNKMAFEAKFDDATGTIKIFVSDKNLQDKEVYSDQNGNNPVNLEAGVSGDASGGAQGTPDVGSNDTGNKQDDTKTEETTEEKKDENPAPIQPAPKTDQLKNGEEVPDLLLKEIDEESVTPEERRVSLDIDFINKVVGSTGNSAKLPEIELVYNKPKASGQISGFGIYPEGNNGFFGFDRSQTSGKLTVRYVFKDSIDGSGNIVGKNLYISSLDLSNGYTDSGNTTQASKTLLDQLKAAVERDARLTVNGDIAGMLAGGLYEDKGIGILEAYKANNTNTLRHISTIRKMLARDTEHNAYLLEVESLVIEGAINSNSYGTFKDTSYVVVQQQGQDFIIADKVRIKREVVKEPEISPDSATAKRLVGFNLAETVTDDNKKAITNTVLSELYTAGTNRVSEASEDAPVKTGDLTITRGLFDCFTSNRDLMSEETYDVTTMNLIGKINSKGTSNQVTYKGKVYEWIGGYQNQAEFMAEELIKYEGTDEGYYMDVYYLVSYDDAKWSIIERSVVDSFEVSGADLASKESSIG